VKEISMNAFRTDDVGLVPPLADMPNSNYWHYSLQLNIYQYILQKKYGMKISNRCLIVLHPENAYKRYLRYELPDLQEIVEKLFELRMQKVVEDVPASAVAVATASASASASAPPKKTRLRKEKGI
jgi:hypothetical protein